MFGKISNKSYDFNPFFVTKVQSQGGIKFDEKFISKSHHIRLINSQRHW